MSPTVGYALPGIAGSGAIACGLAASATTIGDAVLLARSDASAWRAEEKAQALCAKLDGGNASKLRVTTELGDLARCDLVIEAISEDLDAKARLLGEIGKACPDADLATTTSALGVTEIGKRSGHPERLLGLHPFNPVTRMELIEMCTPEACRPKATARARDFCHALGKTVVNVPDQPGFVVNRLLFPYLFDAVRLLERTGMEPEDVDRSMTLGAAHPMGPLALLDFVGLDVSKAIGDSLFADSGEAAHKPPGMIEELIGANKLGRKSGAGFYSYEK